MKIGQLNLAPEFDRLSEGIKIARTEDDIESWFDENRFKVDYTVSGGKVTAKSFKMVGHTDMKGLGVQFDKVNGDFELSHNGLTTLKGCPSEVGGKYIIKGKFIKSLSLGPKVVKGDCIISGTEITSLEGAPTEVGGVLSLSLNPKLTSFKGGPTKVGSHVIVEKNALLQNLDGLPEEIGGTLDLKNLRSGSLKGIGRVKSCKTIVISEIKSNILGLIMIDGLKEVEISWVIDHHIPGFDEKKLKDAINILKPYFGKGRGDKKMVFEAQEKLIDANLDDFAEL